MIDPNNTNTIRVGELPSEPFNLTDNIPHEIGTDLKRGTVQQLTDLIASVIEVTGGVGFRAISVTDGQTLPTTTQQEFILVGKGTYFNVNGGDTLVLTEELNAIVSNGSFWFVGVEIPIDVELAGITQFIREGFTDTAPSENAIFNALANIDLSSKENTTNKQNSLAVDGTGVKFPTVDAINNEVVKVTGNQTILGKKLFSNASPSFTEFARTDILGTAKVSVGMLGAPEANLSFNMDYTTGIHKYYDPTMKAMWLALSGDAFALQYAPEGQPTSGDMWDSSGNRYLFWGNANGQFVVNTDMNEDKGNAKFSAKRQEGAATVGGFSDLVLEGDRRKGVSAPIYLNLYNNGNVLSNLGGGNFGIGTSQPLSNFVVCNNGGLGLEINPTASGGEVVGIFAINRITSALKQINIISSSLAVQAPVLINTQTDNGVDKLQVNGTISASSYTGGATLTGVPTAPTATSGTNTTQIATTAFVTGAITTADSGNVKLTGAQILTNAPKTFSVSNGSSAAVTINNTGSVAGFLSTNVSTQIGSFFTNQSSGIGALFQSQGTSSGDLIRLEGGASTTGLLINGRNNGTTTFTVDKFGVVTLVGGTALNNAVPRSQLLYTNQTITASKTVTIAEFVNNNELILSVDATSGNITITLPTFTALQGYKVTVKKMDSSANSVLIQGVGSVNIDGSASVIISGQYSSSTIGANLSQYIIL